MGPDGENRGLISELNPSRNLGTRTAVESHV
jgi:hypothetical protein